jgi:cation diffusion facilitator family transporter
VSKLKRNRKVALRTIYASIAGNALLALIKGITGYFGNSYALIADAIESTTDVFSSALVWFGLKYSTKPADENHPYGHGKAEPLFTFIVVGFLLISAAVIIHESIENISTPHKVPKNYTLIVLGIIIFVKEVFFRFILRRSRETRSTSLRADAWHHRSDAITSLVAFVGIGIAIIFGEGYETADDWAALIASGFIIYNAYLIFRPALGEIMDEQLHEDLIKEVRLTAEKVKGILDTEKCFIRKVGMTYYVDLHVTVDSDITVKEGHDIAHLLKDAIKEALPEVADVLIHVEPSEISDH